MPAHKTVPTPDGVELAVHDFGGRGPDLLLAHATGLHGMVWEPVVAALTDHFRCVSFDERGHGDSTGPPDGNFHWSGFASDVLAVVDALGLERPCGAGHSCGGAALLLAEEARPGTFGGLWCFEPVVFTGYPSTGGGSTADGSPGDGTPAGAGPGQPGDLAAGARRRRERFPSRQAALGNFSSKPPFDRVSPAALRAYVEHGFAEEADGTVRLKCRPDDEAATYDNSRTHDAFEHLGRVMCPVTLVWGAESDSPFGASTMQAMAARLARARVEAAEGMGHFGPLENPAAVARSIHRGCHTPGVP